MKRLLSIMVIVLMLIALLSTLAFADNAAYVYDEAGLLSASELSDLNAKAEQISKTYSCGVYSVIIEDYTAYGNSIASAAEYLYHYFNLGIGEERNGILLIISMAERDYDICCYGAVAHASFTDYGKDRLADSFLDDFGDNDWYDGFADYVSATVSFFKSYESGTPVDVEPYRPSYLAALGIAMAVSAIVCLVFCLQMRSAKIKTEASDYISRKNLKLRIRQDFYTNTTERVVHIDNNNSRGGTSINSGGFSHKSGKF